MVKSEFGKGLVICLVKFAEHYERYPSFPIYEKWIKATEKDRKLMLSPNPPDKLNYGFPHMKNLRFFVEMADKIYNKDYERYLSKEIEMFMNGASDHLYEIEVPKGKEWNRIRTKVNKLQKKCLKIGHGFTSFEGKKWTLDDLRELFELNRDIALMIDRKLGLKPDKGQW